MSGYGEPDSAYVTELGEMANSSLDPALCGNMTIEYLTVG
jgi:hypothetical protein